MRKFFFTAVVLVMAGSLAGCPSTGSGGGGNTAREEAKAFETAHDGPLGKPVATVTAADAAAVDAALADYAALSADARTLLTVEKTLLDNLKAKINEVPGTGKLAVTLWVNDDGSLAEIPEELVISKSYGETLAVRAAENLTALQWSLNGVDIPAPRGTAREIVFAAASYISGFYTLGLRVEKDGIPYSINITFVVDN